MNLRVWVTDNANKQISRKMNLERIVWSSQTVLATWLKNKDKSELNLQIRPQERCRENKAIHAIKLRKDKSILQQYMRRNRCKGQAKGRWEMSQGNILSKTGNIKSKAASFSHHSKRSWREGTNTPKNYIWWIIPYPRVPQNWTTWNETYEHLRSKKLYVKLQTTKPLDEKISPQNSR